MDSTQTRSIGRVIAELIEEAGITQESVQNRLGLKQQSSVSKWKTGRSAAPKDLTVLATIEEMCEVPRGTILLRSGWVAFDTRAAIEGDPLLDRRGRAALVEMYDFQLGKQLPEEIQQVLKAAVTEMYG